jgi:hypothetical protein
MRQGLYVITSEFGISKIGISYDARARMRELQVGNPEKLYLTWFVFTEHAGVNVKEYEYEIHKFLAPFRVRGEWFKATDHCIHRATRMAWYKLGAPKVWARYCRRYPSHALACPLKRPLGGLSMQRKMLCEL